MALAAGQSLLHFRLVERVGEGGMGVVWRAHDTTLGRDVALKVLPDGFTHDPERLARFEREARLLAALNHPHIASIYGVHSDGDTRFLAMELVEGLDLAERLATGPMPLDEALRVGLQITEALENAHDKGIVHRDLKPANVKRTRDGAVKVLDFGLARAFEGDAGTGSGATSVAHSPTITGHLQSGHVLLGTAAYMSPEQARGQTVDRRADIWAFGALMMEMLTGRRVFEGPTVSDTLASVLKTDPDWAPLPPETPARVRQLLRRCLERDPRRRLRDIGEARIVLEEVLSGAADPLAATAVPVPRRRLPLAALLAAAVAVGAVAGALALRGTRQPAEPVPLRRFALTPPADGTVPRLAAISPDGKLVAYMAANRLYLQDLGALEPRELKTEPGVQKLFWSPDSRWIGYIAGTRVLKIAATGGESQVLCDTRREFSGGVGGTWTEDGSIVVSHGDSLGLEAIPAAGGDPRPLHPAVSAEETDVHEPSALPGGRGILMVSHRKQGGLDNLVLWTGKERRTLVQLEGQNLHNPVWAASGHILFQRAPNTPGIWALPFSLSRLEPTGEPFLVATAGARPSVSRDGTLAYETGVASRASQLVWVDRGGNELAVLGDARSTTSWLPAASRDGARVTRGETEADQSDLWVYDVARGTRTRLTFDGSEEDCPSWSPDGQQVLYHARQRDCSSPACFFVLKRRADGTGTADTLAAGVLPVCSTDGRFVIYTALPEAGARWDVAMVSLTPPHAPTVLVRGNSRAVAGPVSPRGDLVAYMSSESGHWEVYLTRFPSGEGRWQVSVAGGQWPKWNGAGDRLYYVQGDDLMEVELEGGAAPVLGTPRKLFTRQPVGTWSFGFQAGFDLTPDAQRFLVERSGDANQRPPTITVVQNWLAEFAAGQAAR